MSDLFHEEVPLAYIKKVFATIKRNPHHTFQVLTKRSARLVKFANKLEWPHNLWIGVSIENSAALYRIVDLISVPAAVRFLSCEPLIGPLEEIPLADIHWVIVGGESGPGSRPMQESWVDSLQGKCADKGIPFFFKQWGGVRKKRNGRLLKGRIYDDMILKDNKTVDHGKDEDKSRPIRQG